MGIAKKRLSVIVMEDNKIFNSILTRALHEHLIKKNNLTNSCDVKLFSYLDPDDCMEAINGDRFSGECIAFLDYFLGKNINGIQLLKLFKKKNNKIKFVVLSQSALIAKQIEKEKVASDSIFLKKDVYAPDICCLLLEDFVQNQG